MANGRQTSLNNGSSILHDDFRDIVQGLKRVRDVEQLNRLDDNMLFDGAVRIYNSMIINRAMASGARSSRSAAISGVPITEKQRKLLQDLDYKGNIGTLTKTEATKIIESLLESQRAERVTARR